MKANGDFEIFLASAPGLEALLCSEVKANGFRAPKAVPGGVVIEGRWHDVWRANLVIRGASRVLARLATFRAPQMKDLEQRARRVPWASALSPNVPFRVEASCKRSRIYHSGAAAERVETAIRETVGAPSAETAEVTVAVRLENDVCTVSIDTSGELLHKRGFKEAVAKAPMRETMAALFLRQMGYDGREPVVDPMCGAGTFVIEAAEIAAGLRPGRTRAFAFEKLATFDAAAWQKLRAATSPATPESRYFGFDRDANAVAMSRANAERAGVASFTAFAVGKISELQPPEGPPGLVITNPPYGARIGDKKALQPLYRTLGRVLAERFQGWRIGMVASEATLARATGLPWKPPSAPVAHGGLRVTLYETGPLP